MEFSGDGIYKYRVRQGVKFARKGFSQYTGNNYTKNG